jgi:hypothetical protein
VFIGDNGRALLRGKGTPEHLLKAELKQWMSLNRYVLPLSIPPQ